MASNGFGLRLFPAILLVTASPLILCILAIFMVPEETYRLLIACGLLLSGIVAGFTIARRVTALLVKSYDHEKELEMQIIQKDKLAAIGLLTAGIAHELNTPLASALLNTQMLKEDTKREWPDKGAVLDSIEEEIKRAGSVVRNLLEFSRQTQVQSKVTDVNTVLTKLLDISGKLCSEKGIHVHRNLDPGIPIARANASILHQVFMNIVSNAIEAMEDGGTLTVSSRFLPEQRKIIVDIQNTGPGILREHVDGVFDPFFTTKAAEDGTGLGLAISYSMVRKMGGDIKVISSRDEREKFPGETGTIFSIELPAFEGNDAFEEKESSRN